jgi:MFS family permease
MSIKPHTGAYARLTNGLRDSVVQAVIALGITQIIAWGTTLYALGILGRPIAVDTGWSQGLVFGGLTAGLLASSVISAPMGRLIDAKGGRLIMSAGSIATALSLVLVALATTPTTYLGAWAVVGVAMRMTLYDAAFASIVQVTPSRGRRAISYLTLFGGFASTVFWPIGHWLNGAYGWRMTLVIFAAINLFICLPLHWIGLARREDATVPDATVAQSAVTLAAPPLQGKARTLGMILFGVVLAISAFVYGAMAAHLVPLIEASGVSLAAAVTLASLKGFAQVGGRVCELVFGRNLNPVTLGRITLAFLPLSFAILWLGGAGYTVAFAFTMVFGIANGLTTIVRGAVPLALFGREGYGAVLGILATPYLLLNAIAPMIFAMLAERYGYTVSTQVLLAVSALAFVAMEVMAAWYRRQSANLQPAVYTST